MFETLEEFLEALKGLYPGLEEATRVEGSYEALAERIRSALNKWPGRPAGNSYGDGLSVCYTFPDRVIAYSYGGRESQLAWEIPYTLSGDEFTFGVPVAVKPVNSFEPVAAADVVEESVKTPVAESHKPKKKGKLTELIECTLEPLEERAGDPKGGRRVKAIGITVDRLNRNGRLYPRAIVAEALKRLQPKLNESAGQGRFILTGEAEHPSDKKQKAHILETVFRWDAASLNDEGQVILEGVIIPTSKGKDLQTLADFSIPITLSQRGFGESETLTEGDNTYDRVTYLDIRGYDAVAQPSDLTTGLIESLQEDTPVPPAKGNKKMPTLEELLAMLKDKPEMLEAIMSKMGLQGKQELAESMGTTVAMLPQRLQEAQAAKVELDKRNLQESIDQAITDQTKDLPFGEMNSEFIEAVRKAKPATAEAVQPLVESKLEEWNGLMSKVKLTSMGMGNGIKMIGPVFERETGQPEYTKAAWELNESMIKAGVSKRHNLAQAERGGLPGTGSLVYTRQILKRYDENFKAQLIQEQRLFQEAEQTTDLNLPYTVMRTIIEQAYPELIAANIFDFGVANSAPDRLYFETYAGESGVVVAVTSEVIVAALDTWVQMANKRLLPGTITVTNSGATVTYVEGTDYVIDYGDGKIYALSTGAITAAQSIRGNYSYDAFRKGEMAEIERAKNLLAFKTLEIAADRLSTQISNEAIVFSRSQMGYDAVGRTLSNIMKLLRRKIDQDILYEAIGACLIQANNSGGTWVSASDPLDALVTKMGVTKTKVYSHFYTPTAFIMSQTNADRLSNWLGYTRTGFDNAVLTAAGFAGGVKGLPIFASQEFSDGYVLAVNRELVMHRVFQPMQIKGPFPSFSNGKLVAADQYYIEEYNGTDTPVPEKGSYMKIT